MKMILHIFKKDCLALRWWLMVWGLLLLGEAILICSGSSGIPTSSGVFWLLTWFVPVFIVDRLVHDESAVRNTAFWLTRPISGNALWKSRLFFILAVMVLPSLMVEMLGIWFHGFSQYLLPAACEILLLRLVFYFMVWAVCAITETTTQAVLFSVCLGFLLINVGSPAWSLDVQVTTSLTATREIIFLFCGLVLTSGVTLYQYVRRNRIRSILILCLWLLCINWASAFWSWDFWQFENQKVLQDLKIEPRIERLGIPEAVKDPNKSAITGRIAFGIDPKQWFARILNFNSEVRLEDGKIAKVIGKPFGHVGLYPESLPFILKDTEMIVDLDIFPMNEEYPPKQKSFSEWVTFLELSKPFEDIRNKHLSYVGDFELEASELEIECCMPLQQNSKYSGRDRHLKILDINRSEYSVKIEEVSLTLLFRGEPLFEKLTRPLLFSPDPKQKEFIILRNLNRNQTFLSRQYEQSMSPISSHMTLRHLGLQLQNPQDEKQSPQINETWFNEAELVLISSKEKRILKTRVEGDLIIPMSQKDDVRFVPKKS
jgi:hypothetical protein